MRHGAKRITREQILGETAVQFIGRRFLDMGFPWHPTNAPLDAGIDGFVEIRDRQSGEATNAWIAVQSKARTMTYFYRHIGGDWGDHAPQVDKVNMAAIAAGTGLVWSVFTTPHGKIVVVTNLAKSQSEIITSNEVPQMELPANV